MARHLAPLRLPLGHTADWVKYLVGVSPGIVRTG